METSWLLTHGAQIWPVLLGAGVVVAAVRGWRAAGAEHDRRHRGVVSALEAHSGLFDGALAVRGILRQTDGGTYLEVGNERVACQTNAGGTGATNGMEVVAIGRVVRQATASYRGEGGFVLMPKAAAAVDLVPVKPRRSHRGFWLAPLLTALAAVTIITIVGVAGLSIRSRWGAMLAAATPLRERALETAGTIATTTDERIAVLELQGEYCGPRAEWLFGDGRYLEAAGHALACGQHAIAVPALMAAGYPRDVALYAAPVVEAAPHVATAAYILAEDWAGAAEAMARVEGRYCTSLVFGLFAGDDAAGARLKAFGCHGDLARIERAVQLTTSIYEDSPWRTANRECLLEAASMSGILGFDAAAAGCLSEPPAHEIPAWHVARWWRDHPTLASSLSGTIGHAAIRPAKPATLHPATSTALDYLALHPGGDAGAWSMVQHPRVRFALGELYSGRPLVASHTPTTHRE